MSNKTYNQLSQAMRMYNQGMLSRSQYYHKVCNILAGG